MGTLSASVKQAFIVFQDYLHTQIYESTSTSALKISTGRAARDLARSELGKAGLEIPGPQNYGLKREKHFNLKVICAT